MRPQTLAVIIASTVTAVFLAAVGIVAVAQFMPTPQHQAPLQRQQALVFDKIIAPGVPGAEIEDVFELPPAGAAIEPAELPKARGPAVAAKDFAVTGPHTHGNLTVFLIHGEDKAKNLNILTLHEALERGVAVVHDRGVLSVDNRSNSALFIQAGDIVKGGSQDRTLPFDMLISARQNNVSVNALCVEQGRSTPRRNEMSTGTFASSNDQLPGRRLRMAAHSSNQGQVWANVSSLQQNLARTTGVALQQENPTSSLQLLVEHPRVQREVQKHVGELGNLVDGKDDVIGYAVVINGKIQSADVYATNDLFRKLWPKLLKASAVDAVAERHVDVGTVPNAANVKSFLAVAETGTPSRVNGQNRGVTIRHDGPQQVLFETCDPARGNMVLHRSFIAK
jgi:hypothetical protein